MAKVPARIGYRNLVDDGFLEAGSESPALPVTNLQDPDVYRMWRTTGTGSSFILLDAGSQQSFGYAVVVNTNAQSGRIRLSTSDPTGIAGDAHDSEVIGPSLIDMRYRRMAYVFGPEVGRYLRVDLSGAPAPGLEAGRFGAGPTWTLPYDIAASGHQGLWKDNSRVTRGLSGNIFVDIKPRQRGMRLTLPGVSFEEAVERVDEINRIAGVGRDILIMFDPASENRSRDSLWGLQEQPATYRSVDANVYVVDMEIWQRI